MGNNQAKKALYDTWKVDGSGDEMEVKDILDIHPSLINEGLDSDGDTILILASTYNNINIIKFLLSYNNLNINKKNKDGETALYKASNRGHKEVVELLLSHPDINVNIKEKDGWTALFSASYSGHKEIVGLLLSHPNIDIKIKTNDGSLASGSCCNWAKANQANKVIMLEMFKNHGRSKTAMTSSTTKLSNEASSRDVIDQSHDTNLKSFEAVEQKESHLQGESTTTTSITLPLPPNKQTHVFLTHTWREDEKGRNNHDRVGIANEALKKRGLVTWFDSERMSGTVRQAMTDALNGTCCVLVFITRKYEEKVNSKNEADNCYFEFNVAAHNRNLANMRVPIVMEECMSNLGNWQVGGRLSAEVGHQLFFDLSSEDEKLLENQYDKLVGRVVELMTETYPEVSFKNNLQPFSTLSVDKKKSKEINEQNDNSGKVPPSMSVQWSERFKLMRDNERIVLACREIGVDSEDDLHNVLADDELYEQLRSKLLPLDQRKVETVRKKLLS